MSKFNVRVFDKKTNSEIHEDRIGFLDINDREHYGRQFVTVRNYAGVDENVGILNPDGSVDPQAGYHFEVTRND